MPLDHAVLPPGQQGTAHRQPEVNAVPLGTDAAGSLLVSDQSDMTELQRIRFGIGMLVKVNLAQLSASDLDDN